MEFMDLTCFSHIFRVSLCVSFSRFLCLCSGTAHAILFSSEFTYAQIFPKKLFIFVHCFIGKNGRFPAVWNIIISMMMKVGEGSNLNEILRLTTKQLLAVWIEWNSCYALTMNLSFSSDSITELIFQFQWEKFWIS